MVYIKIQGSSVQLGGQVASQAMLDDGWTEYNGTIPEGVTFTWDSTNSQLVGNIQPLKDDKVLNINESCRDEILKGFTSSALGTPHRYQSEEIDQLNLVGMVAAGVPDYFKAGAISGNDVTWGYVSHTVAQLTQALRDGKTTKLQLLQRANTLKTSIHSATTMAELDAIVW